MQPTAQAVGRKWGRNKPRRGERAVLTHTLYPYRLTPPSPLTPHSPPAAPQWPVAHPPPSTPEPLPPTPALAPSHGCTPSPSQSCPQHRRQSVAVCTSSKSSA